MDKDEQINKSFLNIENIQTLSISANFEFIFS